MFLKRINIPHFRVLENVDLHFETDFTPTIFPVGSLNGGGKSTLLQLVFILLHCSFEKSRHQYLSNLLSKIATNNHSEMPISIAYFELLEGEKEFSLEFILHPNNLNFDILDTENIKERYSLYTDSLKKTYLSTVEKIEKFLTSENYLYIAYVIDENDTENKSVLLCRTTESLDFLKKISSKVYLATPGSQILLFLHGKSRRKVLYTDKYVVNGYFDDVKIAKENLLGLFSYEFESTDLISNAFKKARDKDFEEALIAGEYGENLKKLKEELHNFFFGKTITIAPDFSRVIFKLENSDEELYAEDLSHGELRKLSIYLWLRSNEIKDSVILMDEIEIGMHPDWQYEIVNDLQTWSNNNQFILATHSYELCQAVTPAHVSELNPKLIKQ